MAAGCVYSESCGVGCQAQVLRIATILYSLEGTARWSF